LTSIASITNVNMPANQDNNQAVASNESKVSECSKAQPWKSHWPPASNVKESILVNGVAGEVLEIDGGGRS
jgi:hypothetical protein